MSVSLDISRDGAETGALLRQLLQDRGIYDSQSKNVVCYGRPHFHTKNMINGNRRGENKIDNMRLMQEAGCRVVPWFEGTKIPRNTAFPLLARKSHGMGGTDIVPVFQPKEVEWRVAAGWNWFSSYVPVATEFRVWVWRREHLDTYEKVMQRPADYKYIGRNFRNGFEFRHRKPHVDAFHQAELALAALNLDFAAIDMLQGEDGHIYILEANTAPGVIRSGAQATLAKLADKIEWWDANGYPKR